MEKIKKLITLFVFLVVPFVLHPLNNLFLRFTSSGHPQLYHLKPEHIFFYILIAVLAFVLYEKLFPDLKMKKWLSWSKVSLSLVLTLISTYFTFFPFEYPLFESKITLFHFIVAPLFGILGFMHIQGILHILFIATLSLIVFTPFYLLGWLLFNQLRKLPINLKKLHIIIIAISVLICLLADPEFILRGIEF